MIPEKKGREKRKHGVFRNLSREKENTTISMLFNVPASEADLRRDLLACRLRNIEEEKEETLLHVSSLPSFLPPFFSLFFLSPPSPSPSEVPAAW